MYATHNHEAPQQLQPGLHRLAIALSNTRTLGGCAAAALILCPCSQHTQG